MRWLRHLARPLRPTPRRTYRPCLQALEDRLCPSVAAPPAVTVGALGDSYTDEYRFYPPDRSQARGWVEILAALEPSVQFGPFTTAGRGGTRNQGFAFDWALQGAQSTGMVRDQLPGLAAQVARGQVQYVGIFIGSNDFGSLLQAVSDGVLSRHAALSRLRYVEARAEANVRAAVGTLLAANPNVKVVVANLFDLSLLPQIRALHAPRPLVAAVWQATQDYNAALAATAAANGRVALLDLAGLVGQFAQQAGATGRAPFGGTTVNVTSPGDGTRHFWLADGIHFGTVAQGMIAAAFIEAVDAKFGAGLAPLSPDQIVWFANHAGPDTA